ncbi:MAG: hypothetical protein WD766_03570 [Gemmatimonadota bacterium]
MIPTSMRDLLVVYSVVAAFAFGRPEAASAQLRPYDPFVWDLYVDGTDVFLQGGAAVLNGQRASLAGTEGTLVEAGRVRALARTGRVTIEAAGTIRRFFEEESRFAAPDPAVLPITGSRRADWGDYLLITTVAVTPPRRQSAAALRFGTRLPTTDNRIGLERDMTDFFALVLARTDRWALRFSGEIGVGIHGTRSSSYEQSDVLVVLARVEVPDMALRPSLSFVGHADGLPGRTMRGNEELAELRAGIRTAGRNWVTVESLLGLTPFSPRYGVSISVGTTR